MPAPVRRPLAVLFDLDGTLIDSIQLLLESVQYAFRERAAAGRRVPSEAEWIAGIGTPLVAQLRPYVDYESELALLVAGYRAYQGEHHDRLTRCYDRTVEVVTALRERPGFQHVVVTGRDASPGLIAAADLVSEVVKVKHPMDQGIRAQQGIEW